MLEKGERRDFLKNGFHKDLVNKNGGTNGRVKVF